MLDRDTKKKIKQKANELTDINLSDGQAYAVEYKAMYESGKFNCGECFLISRLVDLYTAIKQGIVDKDEGKLRQKQLFDTVEFEE